MLAEALAKETGETMARTITIALRERLARIRKANKTESRAAELLAIGRACASHLVASSCDDAELLDAELFDDEQGLPK